MIKTITNIITYSYYIGYYSIYVVPTVIMIVKTTASCTYFAYYGIKKGIEYKLIKN
jgi:hypothetical protein